MVDPMSAILGAVAVLALLTLIAASVLYGERRAMNRDGVIDADAVQEYELRKVSVEAVRQDVDDTERT
jgi:hypothetical protein